MGSSGIKPGILINLKVERLAEGLKSYVLLGFMLFMSFMVSEEGRICPRAPSTSTPEIPTTAPAHASSSVSGFIPKGRTGHSQLYPFTRPNRFALATAHEFASPGFAQAIAPFGRWFGYMYDGQFTWLVPRN